MKKNILKLGTVLGLVAMPLMTFAAGKDLQWLMQLVTNYFENFIILIISLAVVTFTWNIYRYFFTEKDKKEAGLYVLYSTVGFFVILSIWGLVNILTNTLQLNNGQPTYPFGASSGTTNTNNVGPLGGGTNNSGASGGTNNAGNLGGGTNNSGTSGGTNNAGNLANP